MVKPYSTDLDGELRALGEAAHKAAKTARKTQDPRAFLLKRIALETDDLVEGRVAPDPTPQGAA